MSAERGANVAQRALGGLQRQIALAGQRFDAREQLVQTGERLAPLPPVGLFRFGVARGHARLGGGSTAH